MKHIYNCRRTFLGLTAIVCLTALGFFKGTDVSVAISGIVLAVAGANAYEKKN